MKQEQAWDSISGRWRELKVFPFKKAINFIKNKKGRILDVGCGGGRNFVKTKATIYGVDFSEKMLNHAKEYSKKLKIKVKLEKAQAYNLPFKDNFFDAAIVIATLHCIDSKEKRKKALEELYRVLKPGTEAIIAVWSRNEKRIKNKPKESMIPWTVNNKKYYRYTYIYEKKELAGLLKKTGFKILKIHEDRNITAYIEKPKE